MLDCGICLTNPTAGASRVRLLERGVEAHGRVDLCFPPVLPLFVCRSRVSRPGGVGGLPLPVRALAAGAPPFVVGFGAFSPYAIVML